MSEPTTTTKSEQWLERFWQGTEAVILGSRIILIPFFLVLLFQLGIIFIDFLHIIGMFSLFGAESHESTQLTEHTIKTLELLDITMIANLIWLIAAGSYYVFVDNHNDVHSKRRPRALQHVSSGLLKEKMAGSIIGISSVHLLQMFLDISEAHDTVDWVNMSILGVIHLLFIIGLVIFAYVNSLSHHNHKPEETTHA